MKHINLFPAFTPQERRDLCAKILAGIVITEVRDTEHKRKSWLAGDHWTLFPCWIPASKWTDGKGFKKLKFKNHTLYIHRAAYEVIGSSDPNSPNYGGTPVTHGRLLDHKCRDRSCCQPEHLEPVTPKVNIERGANTNHMMRKGVPPPVQVVAAAYGGHARPLGEAYVSVSTHDLQAAAAERREFVRRNPAPDAAVALPASGALTFRLPNEKSVRRTYPTFRAPEGGAEGPQFRAGPVFPGRAHSADILEGAARIGEAREDARLMKVAGIEPSEVDHEFVYQMHQSRDASVWDQNDAITLPNGYVPSNWLRRKLLSIGWALRRFWNHFANMTSGPY